MQPEPLPPIDLVEVERAVRLAIDERDQRGLSLIGSGEFSLAMAWPSVSPHGVSERVVLKRVPPFRTRSLAEQYGEVTRRYIHVLAQRGVSVLGTEVLLLDRTDGSAVAFHCQPLLEPGSIGSEVLRRSDPAQGHPLVEAVVMAVDKAVDARTGLDAQFANWSWDGETAWLLDLSTPMLLDDTQMVLFDVDAFLSEYPWFLRRIVFGEFVKIVPRYTTSEGVLHDVLAMLLREGLEPWTPVVIDAAKRLLGIDLSVEAAVKIYREDRRMFPVLLRLKRLQRFWVQHTGRRYDSLLPVTSSFGPQPGSGSG